MSWEIVAQMLNPYETIIHSSKYLAEALMQICDRKAFE
jgi:hypothetical protein